MAMAMASFYPIMSVISVEFRADMFDSNILEVKLCHEMSMLLCED